MKAIETKYKGYRFRSRLEARWAVFFDTLKITWLYEDEGYDCEQVGWYLPDFFLPDLHWIIEVKANPAVATQEEKAKINALAGDPPPGYAGVIVVGQIELPDMRWYTKDKLDNAGWMGHLVQRLFDADWYYNGGGKSDIMKAVLRARQWRF